MATILVVDDHTDIRENIAEILTLAGYSVLEADNGKKAMELAIKHLPDLIVCDIMMPELDGYGVLHLLRKNSATEHIPLIFITARTERSDFRKGMEMGADDYITKPFDDVELLTAVEARLKKQQLLQQKFTSSGSGVTELLTNWQQTGLLRLDLDSFDSTSIHKKQAVYREGKKPQFLYYIRSGKVKVFRINDDGKEYITNLFSEGDYFGYAAIMQDTVYAEQAEVLENAELILIPREVFMQQLLNDVTIARAFIRHLATEIKEKEERLLQLAYDSLRKRVAQALLNIYDKLHCEDQDAVIELSREDIARYVGTATESLIRTISDFKSEQLIEVKGTRIRLVKPDGLRKLIG